MVKQYNKKIINTKNSIKFTKLYFLLSFFVVFIHSYTYYNNVNDVQWIIQKAISDNICRVAVPLFFTFSGFFLFLKYENTWESYKSLILKKIRSLVIPYFLWSIITFFIMFCIQYFYQDLNQDLIINQSLSKNILSILKGQNTILWFVRILFIFNLFAPIIKIVIDKDLFVIPILTILFIIDFTNNNIDFFFFKTDSLLFFLLGGILSRNISLLDKKLNYILLFIISVILAALNIYTDYATNINVNDVNIFERLFILTFSLFLWNWKYIYVLLEKIPSKYYHYSFTIYIFHAHIMVIIIKKLFLILIPIPIIAFVFTGFTTFILSLFLSVLLEKYLPEFYNLLSGARRSRA